MTIISNNRFQRYLAAANLDSKPHQIHGVQWCLKKELKGTLIGQDRIRGGIIADEMGLGKTIQVIGTIVSNLQIKTLIVLPLVLVQQWKNVFIQTMKHTPIVYHGYDAKYITIERLQNAPVVITTYGMIAKRNYKNQYSILHQIKWNRIVFDEAHHLRNKKTGVFQGASILKANIRWLVTGTIIQNSIKDFYAACHILGIREEIYTNQESWKFITKNLVIRRTKEQVGIVLPELHITQVEVPWNDQKQNKLAQLIHSTINTANTASELQIPFDERPIQRILLARQICIAPSMLIKNAQKLLENSSIDQQTYEFIAQATSFSNKIDTLVQNIYARKDNGNRKIIFSQFHTEIDIITQKLIDQNISVYVYDGRTPIQKRNLLHNAHVFILQIQTACEGLNLQNFNEIYFVAPVFNPAVEDQAIARCHRIGQNKPVHVFRFYMLSNEWTHTHQPTQHQEDQEQHSENQQQNTTKTIEQLQTKTIEQLSIIIQNKKRIIAKSIF
jgi:SNF2 family DNA or RNA helicase